MKKLAILLVVSLFFMMACGNKDVNEGISIEPNDTAGAGPYANYYENARDESVYRQEYALRLSEEPEELAEFLLATNELNEFVEVDTKDRSKTIENAVVVFSENEDVHQKALERAKEVFANTHIDCNWEELRKIAPRSDDFATYEEYKDYMEQNTLAIDAETGEPISNEPAGPWAGPAD